MRLAASLVLLSITLSVLAAEGPSPGYHPLSGAESSAACARGYREMLAGDLAAARTSFEAALKAKPEAAAHFGSGLIHGLSGEDQAALEQYAAALKSGTQDPWAEGYLLALWRNARTAREVTPVVETLTNLGMEVAAPARLRDLAAFVLGQWMVETGRWEAARSSFGRLQYLRSWQLIGPFDNRDASGMAKAYAPEETIDLEKSVEGRHRRVEWFRCAAEPMDGAMDLAQLFEPNTHSLAYALSHVKVEKSQWTVLHAGSGGASRIWINGREVLAIDEYNSFAAEKKAVPVYLHAGWNRVLVKVAANEIPHWAFVVRLSALQGGPVPGLEVSSSAEASKAYATSAEGRGTPLLEPEVPELGLLPRVEAALRKDPEHPWLRRWRGWLMDVWGLGHVDDDPSVTEYRRALAKSPQCPLFLVDLMSAAGDVNLARQTAEKCQARFPELPQSWEMLTEISANAGLEPTTEAYAREGLARFGPARAGTCAAQMAEILIQRGQLAEAERLARVCVETRPYESDNWQLLLGTLPGRAARRIVLSEALRRCGGDRALLRLQATERMLQKKEGEAAELQQQTLCAEPCSVASFMDVATDWARAGRSDKAFEILQAARRIAPEHPGLLATIGTELLRAEKREEAVAVWRDVLRIKPDSPHVKDWLAEVDRGGAIDREFFAAYDVEARELPRPQAIDYPNDLSVKLLHQEVIHVNPNGSVSRMEHQVAKLLRPDGAGKLRQQRIFYEPGRQTVDILRAAVIRPDGTEMSRAQITDRTVSAAMGVETRIYDEHHLKEIVFPDIEPGSIVDFQYILRDTGGNIYGDFFADTFYFGDDQPVLKSQYVLDLPKARTFQMHSFRAPLEPRRIESKDPEREVVIWEREKVSGIVLETRMPPLLDLLPFVQVTTMASWKDVGMWYWNLCREQLNVDDDLRDLAVQITRDAPTAKEKVRAIHDWVIRNIRYLGIEFGRNGYKPHRASDTYKALYGDCKDTAALIVTLLKAVGIDARMVLVRTTPAGRIEADALPAPNLFNHCIAYVPGVEGQDYWIDGTTDHHQLGEVPYSDQGAQVLVVGPEGGEFVQIPLGTAGENRNEASIQATVQKNGSGVARLRRVYRGQVAPYVREQIDTPGTFRSTMQAQAAQRFPGAELTRLAHSRPEDQGPVWVESEFSIPNFAARSGDRLALLSSAEVLNLSQRFLSGGERRHDLQIWFPFSEAGEVNCQLEPGLRPVGLPEEAELKEPFATYRRKVTVQDQHVRIVEEFSLNSNFIAKDQYARFSAFCHKVDALQAQKLLVQPQ